MASLPAQSKAYISGPSDWAGKADIQIPYSTFPKPSSGSPFRYIWLVWPSACSGSPFFGLVPGGLGLEACRDILPEP